ncbi:hypothetical protein GLYMA_11G108102v4 [Glycine max]|nr:hypothetical protein GLYMA_11G108102v4 [Glycine max]KAH1158577.1 hypothetical protein GYH30_030673 [Glycine max]
MSVLQILYIQFDIHGQSFTSVTPPRSATTPQADVSLAHLMQHDDIHVQSFTSEQIKETFDVARNSIELLSVFFNAAGCVKESSIPDVHRIVETGIMKQCFSRP